MRGARSKGPFFLASDLPSDIQTRAALDFSIEHPSGEFSVEFELEHSGGAVKLVRSSLIKTACALFRGELLVPASVWEGKEPVWCVHRKVQ